MTREQLLDYVAPCGLMCYTCPGFENSAIKHHSAALLRLREGYREFLDMHLPEEYRFVLDEHDKYMETLARDSAPTCVGCRKNCGDSSGCIKDCFIHTCVKTHDVDFCGECPEFPCARLRNSDVYEEEAKRGILNASSQIKEVGAEHFFEMKKDTSHYLEYLK